MAFEDGDDLSNDIAEAFKEAGSTAPSEATPASDPAPVAETPVVESEQKDSERQRDEKGRFAPKAETEGVKPEAPTQEAAPEQPKQQTQEQPKQPASQPIPAPLNWNGKGKVEWARLPQHVQKEITNDYQRLNDLQARQQRLDAVIGPERAQILTAQYGGVEQALGQLLALSDMADKNPAGFVQYFMRQRGLNPTQLFGQGAAQGEDQPAQGPNPFEQRFASLERRLDQFFQSQTQSTQTQALSEVERFASDPTHPYFNDVKVQMGALMHTGKAKTMQDAYDMACWADPEIREQLLTDQRQRLADEEAARVRAAREAQVSISGSPAGASVPEEESDDDLETLIRKEAKKKGLAA